MNSIAKQRAEENFHKARSKEVIQKILSLLQPEKNELLSFYEVKDILKPKSETYGGIQEIPIEKIVGSEGRYQDFNRNFLPRHEHIKGRWTGINAAHLQDQILPPIKLYEIGGVYFVRDGNHRVSVFRQQGVKEIDAEVMTLKTQINITPDMTVESLRRAVINYEKELFYQKTKFHQLIPDFDLVFTSPGRYDEVICDILGHKYYLNLDRSQEISFEDAMISWYNNVFRPIVGIIHYENLLYRFPGRTAADLYVWIVKHWHLLKEKFGQDYPLNEAVDDFSAKFGTSLWKQFKKTLRSWLKK